MSVKFRVAACCALASAVLSRAALASELSLDAPLADPLRVRPLVLQSGSILPGDTSAVRCPAAAPAGALTLSEAVDLALCNNAQIRSTWTEIKVQASAVGQARAAYLPTLSVTGSHLDTRSTYANSFPPSDTTVGNAVHMSMNWRLFDFGARAANRQAANTLLLAAMENHGAALQKALATTIQAYFDVQASHALWRAKEKSVEIAQGTLASAQRRASRGDASRSDVLQATTVLAKATLERGRNWNSYRKAMAVLTYILGLTPDSEPGLADEQDDGDLPVAAERLPSLPRLLADTRQRHPAILAARDSWHAAQDKVRSVQGEGLPTVDFSANYDRNGYPGQALSSLNSRVRTVAVSVTFPIFDGFAHSYKVRGAQAQAEQREGELNDVEHNVLMEVVKDHVDTLASFQNLEASRLLLRSAQEALDTAARKYDKGATDILEVLNTQNALIDALQERARCLSDWRSARLRLLASSGAMGREDLQRGR